MNYSIITKEGNKDEWKKKLTGQIGKKKKTANSKSYSQLSVVYKTCSFNEKRALTYMLQVEVKYTV